MEIIILYIVHYLFDTIILAMGVILLMIGILDVIWEKKEPHSLLTVLVTSLICSGVASFTLIFITPNLHTVGFILLVEVSIIIISSLVYPMLSEKLKMNRVGGE